MKSIIISALILLPITANQYVIKEREQDSFKAAVSTIRTAMNAHMMVTAIKTLQSTIK